MFEVVVVERAHFPAPVLALAEELLLGVLEGALEEKLLVLIGALLGPAAANLDALEDHAFLLVELLQLDVVQLVVVEVLAQQDVQVRSGQTLLLLRVEQRLHLVGHARGRGERELDQVLAIKHRNIKSDYSRRSITLLQGRKQVS